MYLLYLTVVATVVSAPHAALAFAGGDGSSTYPYRITNCAELQTMSDHPTAAFAVMNDITDCGSWTPLTGFSGTLDGRNHTISNITINSASSNDQAMFSTTANGATIQNLTVASEAVTGHNRVAGLVASVNGTLTVNHVSVDATIVANSYAGGLIAQVVGSGNATVESSSTSGSITMASKQVAGGLIGELDTGAVSDSYTTVAITESGSGGNYNGGLLGFMYESASVERSYAAGSISGTDVAGGITGAISTGSTISDSFSTETFTSSSRYGGLVGDEFTGTGTITNSYFDQTNAATANCDQTGSQPGCSAVNTDGSDGSHFANTTAVEPFATGGWDFTNVWTMNSGLPTLRGTSVGSLADFTLPGVPQSLSADTGVGPAVDLTWNAPSSAGGYAISDYVIEYRLHTGDNSGSWSTFNHGASTSTAATVTGLTPSTDYDFRVSAVNDLGQGDPTDSVTATSGVEQVYDITNCDQLQAVNNDLAGSYTLHNDIDCSDTVNWNNGAGFMPLGPNPGIVFTGIFDGQGHTIRGLTINQPNESFVGLFGFEAGQISNVNLQDVNITGGDYTGGLAGVLIDCTTSEVSVSGSVVGNSGIPFNDGPTVVGVGGVAGILDNALLTQASSSATVTGYSDDNGADLEVVGGLIGEMIDSSTLSDSYSTTTAVSGNGGFVVVGGTVGWVLPIGGEGDSSTVQNVYSAGSVSGQTGNLIGGLLGGLEGGQLINSYSAASMSAPDGMSYGGLIGESSGTVTNSFVDVGRSGVASCLSYGDVEGCTLVNTMEEQDSTYFFGNNTNPPLDQWDFDNVWNTRNGNDPVLQFQHLNQVYTITNCDELQAIQNDPAGDYTLANNIDCSDTNNWNYSGDLNANQGFAPITDFTGTLDGQGHTISGLYIYRDMNNAGLFATTNGASISNLTLTAGETGSYTAVDHVGSLAGTMTDTDLSNITVNNSIDNADNAGLVAGDISCSNNNVSISNVTISGQQHYYNSDVAYFGGLAGTVSGTSGCAVSIDHVTNSATSSFDGGGGIANIVGGLVGSIGVSGGSQVSLDHVSYTADSLGGRRMVGGLVGQTGTADEGSAVVISNSFSSAAILGDQAVLGSMGGLVGDLEGASSISNSYATGDVGGSDNTGGLVGQSSGSIDHSYATGNVTGNNGASSIGGLVGYMHDAGSVSDAYATGNVTGGDDTIYVGGLVGLFGTGSMPNPSINNSYASGAVNGTSVVGGLVGLVMGSVSNSFSVGQVAGSNTTGGIYGEFDGIDGGTSTNNVYDAAASGQDSCAAFTNLSDCQSDVGVTPVNTINSPNYTYFINNHSNVPLDQWDFSSIWHTNPGQYPLFVTLGSIHGGGSSSVVTVSTPQPTAAKSVKVVATDTSSQTTDPPTQILLNDFNDFLAGGGHEIDGLTVGQVIYFDITVGGKLEHHSATVKEIGSNYVVFTIASTPFDVKVEEGKTQSISIAGTPAIAISLRSITNGTANVTFAQLRSTPTTATSNAQATSKSSSNTLYWTLLVLLVLSIGWLLMKRRRSRTS